MSLLGGWAAALRMARREALRARGRSVLVLVMIALPVLGVSCADVIVHTSQVSGTEALDRRVGTADAMGTFQSHRTRVLQGADPDRSGFIGSGGARQPDTRLSAVSAALGRTVRGLERREGNVRVTTDKGQADVMGTELDLRQPLSHGLYLLEQGRLPRSSTEVVVNQALADRGDGIGSTLQVVDGPALTVVGLVRDASVKEPGQVVGLPGSLDLTTDPHDLGWLVDAGGPVTWPQVRALNRIGASVVSTWVLEHPPGPSQVPPQVRDSGGGNSDVITVAVLVVVMALIEVVLLAGPAFAVGARRQQRSMALAASSGATPRQMRRIVLATAVVLGGAAAVLGLVLGIGLARVLLPLVQRFSGNYFGPFDLRWLELAGITLFGFASALLASYVPAWLASRQDVVAVLGGRRGDPRPRARSPILGLVLFGLGVLGAVHGAGQPGGGETFIAGSAILVVLGMVLLIPVVLTVLGRASPRLPLTMRFAVRDATRHRTRTVPAVAAVAATVAGVVALGIGMSSDEAQNRGTYVPSLAMGSAVLTGGTTPAEWAGLTDAVHRELPGARPVVVQGIPEQLSQDRYRYLEVNVRAPQESYGSYGSMFGSSVLVGGSLPRVDVGVPASARGEANRVLARGGAVVLSTKAAGIRRARVVAQVYHGDQTDPPRRSGPVLVDALVVRSAFPTARAQGGVAPAGAARLGVRPSTTGLWIPGPVPPPAAQDLTEEAAAVAAHGSFYVERGYQADNESRIVQLVLGVLGAVLMLGGTLTATFLSLSDARSDLATLSAVGASPRVRRRVAASYAAVTGLVGALLGVLVGFVPGIAVTFPLTRGYSGDPGGTPSHFLDIPWLLIGSLVVVLPLLTALVVGLASRSRLPLVARVH